MGCLPLRVSCSSPVHVQLARGGGGGGGAPSPFPHVPGSGSCTPLLAGLCVRGGGALGVVGGGVCVPPCLGGVVEGGRKAGGRQSLCLSPPLCLRWAGTKAGFFGAAQSMEDLVSILLRFVSAHCRLDAVRGVPLRAGAGLQSCRGHCGSGRVTVLGARGVWA